MKRVRKVLDSSFLLISYIQIITLSWYTLTLVFFWPLIFHFKIMKWRHLYSFLLCPYLSSNCMNIQVEEINLYSFIFLRLKLRKINTILSLAKLGHLQYQTTTWVNREQREGCESTSWERAYPFSVDTTDSNWICWKNSWWTWSYKELEVLKIRTCLKICLFILIAWVIWVNLVRRIPFPHTQKTTGTEIKPKCQNIF